MKFDAPLDGVSASGNRPATGAHRMHVVKVEDAKSRNGNSMLVLHLDMTDAPFTNFFSKKPLRLYREYTSDYGKRETKRVLTAFVEENPGCLSLDDIKGDTFDENRLVGLIIGAVINRRNNYLNVQDIGTIAWAKEQKVVDQNTAQPTPTTAPATDNSGLPF